MNKIIECSKCHISKSYIDYHKDKSTKTGYTSWCKACRSYKHKVYVANNPTLYKAISARCRAKHPERRAWQQMKWQQLLQMWLCFS